MTYAQLTKVRGLQIDLSVLAYRKLMAWTMQARRAHMEVSSVGEVKALIISASGSREFAPFKVVPPAELPVRVVFSVQDVFLLGDSDNTAVETNISPERMMRFVQERMAAGLPIHNIKAWCHNHPMATGWSGTDENGARNTPMGGDPSLVGWTISIVHTEIDGWIGRYDQYEGENRPAFTVAVPVTVAGTSEGVERACYAEIAPVLTPKVIKHLYSVADAQQAADAHQMVIWKTKRTLHTDDEFDQRYDECATCGCYLTANDKYCPYCGENAEERELPEDADDYIYGGAPVPTPCPNCNEERIVFHSGGDDGGWTMACMTCDVPPEYDYLARPCDRCSSWAVLTDSQEKYICQKCYTSTPANRK